MTEAAIRHNERTRIVRMLDAMKAPVKGDAGEAWLDGREASVCRVLQCDIESKQQR